MVSIALKVKAKNGILQRFIDSKGWKQSDLARELGLHPTEVGRWFNMKDYPRSPDRMLRLSVLVGKDPEEIFPPPLMDRDWLTGAREWTVHREVSIDLIASDELALIPAPDRNMDAFALEDEVDLALKTLLPREEKAVRMKMGIGRPEATYGEIAEEFGVTRERARQIEMRALHKLRRPSKGVRLRDFAIQD